ncbi:hypothetical protein LSM04_001330 [Trypanosoma melophagium]|uniref:uncharacterized protein n=1 Tax=Trypanosoma melophagium TaxID=715481 RepID=UPI00351A55A7|nr:hypothetical protein LSM04_001330 [Trypanosoma melophagium]
MSFSVSTKEFVPYDGTYHHGMDIATSPAAAAVTAATTTITGVGAAASPVMSGSKSRVCVAFYEAAECPYNNHCEHAHHYTELDSRTQEKLLSTVPIESIPKHFVAPLSSADSTSAVFRAAFMTNITRTGTTAGTGTPKTITTTTTTTTTHGDKGKLLVKRRGKRGIRLHDLSGSNVFEHSFSSLASSTDSFFLGSAHESKDVSPHKGIRRDDGVESFRIRLPVRCRYPHRSTPGTYYDVLGVPRSAPQEEIIASYRRWQKEYKQLRQVDQWHADARDNIVVEARNVIGHPVLRSEYDRTLPPLWTDSKDGKINKSSSNRNLALLGAAAAATSSTNSSCSANIEMASVHAATLQMARSGSSTDMLSLTATGVVDDSIW